MAVSNRDAFIASWSPLIGREAATLHRRSLTAFRFAVVLLAVGIPLVVIGDSLTFPPMTFAGLALSGAGLAGLGCALTWLHRAFRPMSRHMGVRVSLLSSPPLRHPGFERWCSKRGVDQTGGRPTDSFTF